MLSALATGHKVGIAVMAAVFVAFALTSSFLLPAIRPQFPGRGLRWFVSLTVLMTAGMLTAVIALGGESKEAKGAESTSAAATTSQPAPAAAGDAAAGKQLFTAQGCGSCHTFTPAGATGKVGPDLDHLAADAKTAGRGSVAQYATESIEDPGAYVVPGFPKGVMPTFQLGKQQVADLVAFLTSSS